MLDTQSMFIHCQPKKKTSSTILSNNLLVFLQAENFYHFLSRSHRTLDEFRARLHSPSERGTEHKSYTFNVTNFLSYLLNRINKRSIRVKILYTWKLSFNFVGFEWQNVFMNAYNVVTICIMHAYDILLNCWKMRIAKIEMNKIWCWYLHCSENGAHWNIWSIKVRKMHLYLYGYVNGAECTIETQAHAARTHSHNKSGFLIVPPTFAYFCFICFICFDYFFWFLWPVKKANVLIINFEMQTILHWQTHYLYNSRFLCPESGAS